MPRTLLVLAAVVVLAYAGLCAFLFAAQRSMMYLPQPRGLAPGVASMTLPVDGEKLVVTIRPHDGPKALIYFGGNAEDVSYNLPGLSAAFPGHAIYLLHYRGYGGSTGKPSEAALIADSLALFDQVHAAHADITVVGRSLGSGVAVHLASLRPVARLVLVTPYDSIQELAARQFPYVPVRWLLQDKYESWKYAMQVTAPTLIIAAENDEVIPRASTESLYAHFLPRVAAMTVVPGASHNTISESPDYLRLMRGLR